MVTKALLLLLLFSGIEPLTAQTPGVEPREGVGMRIEALLPRWEDARNRAQAAETAREDSIRAANQEPQDTVSVGPITIVTLAGQGELAKDLFSGPVAEIAPMIKGHEHLLEEYLWIFSYHWRWKHVYAEAEFVLDVTMSRRYSRARVIERIRHTLGQALLARLPGGLSDLEELASPRSVLPGSDWSWVYRELATAPNRSAEECLAGDLSWCWEAAGVVSAVGGGEWDTPAKQRALVSSRYERVLWNERDRFGTLESLVRGCLVLEDDRACQLVLEGRHLSRPSRYKDYRVPLDRLARGTLLGEALRLGGEGSFGRLLSDEDASTRDRLSAAAGMPPDELMARWLDRVKESRPNAQAGLLLSPLSLLLWLALFTYLATRSSRWRLG